MTHRFSFGLFVGLLLLCSVFAGCGSQQPSVPKQERVVTETPGRGTFAGRGQEHRRRADPVGICCLCGGRFGRSYRRHASVSKGVI